MFMALAGVRCHWPGCDRPLTTLVNGEPVPDSEIAHIHAKQPGGKRHDRSWTSEQLNGFENLLLRCPPHHKVIDGTEGDDYTVEELERWKRNHLPPGRVQAPGTGAAAGHRPTAAPVWRTWPAMAELDALAAGVRPSRPHGGDTLPAYVPRDLDPQLTESLTQAGVPGFDSWRAHDRA
ncbi:hypothetical protein ABZW30_33750 [Kitasatospora sp. NPDC004669]|uniref:hypothetical protein n=1 Tax=Kitasatospora sp. NPDC004669 TaxID=3154555 RepID=UPI0033BC2834